MALTRDNPRKFDISNFSAITAGTAIYEGAAVAVIKTTGLAIGGTFSAALHRFAGFAKNSAAIGARVTLQPKGRIILTVAGATDASANAVVYASDDDTFNLTGAGISVGRVAWYQGSDVCVVEFDAASDMDAARIATDGNTVLAGPDGAGDFPLGRQSITASDVGSAWQKCPGVIAFTSTLVSGSATVLLEFKTELEVVTTAATVVNDVVAQALHTAFDARNVYLFRFRRSSGTGVVTILY